MPEFAVWCWSLELVHVGLVLLSCAGALMAYVFMAAVALLHHPRWDSGRLG